MIRVEFGAMVTMRYSRLCESPGSNLIGLDEAIQEEKRLIRLLEYTLRDYASDIRIGITHMQGVANFPIEEENA